MYFAARTALKVGMKIGEVSVALFRGAKNLAAIEAVGCIYCGLYLEQQNRVPG